MRRLWIRNHFDARNFEKKFIVIWKLRKNVSYENVVISKWISTMKDSEKCNTGIDIPLELLMQIPNMETICL